MILYYVINFILFIFKCIFSIGQEILEIIIAVKRFIASKIKVFVYIIYLCVLCIFIMHI